jgi:hypothetical protein
MGSFLSKKRSVITAHPMVDSFLVSDAVLALKERNPDCIVSTIALKEEDVYVPQTLGLNHYVVTYDAVTQRVIRVYSDL